MIIAMMSKTNKKERIFLRNGTYKNEMKFLFYVLYLNLIVKYTITFLRCNLFLISS